VRHGGQLLLELAHALPQLVSLARALLGGAGEVGALPSARRSWSSA